MKRTFAGLLIGWMVFSPLRSVGADAPAAAPPVPGNQSQPNKPVSPEDLKRGLILYYNFDKQPVDGKIPDLSGQKNDGQAVGVEWVAAGHRGGSVSFGLKDSYITVPNNDGLNPARLTLAAWIKTSFKDAIWRRIFDKGTGIGYDLTMGGDVGPGKKSSQGLFCLEIGPGGFDKSAVEVTDGRWHFVVGTFDGSRLREYVDGQALGGGSAGKGNPAVNQFDLTIGANRSNPDAKLGEVGASFNGLMDDVMMFNRALSPEEIQALYTLLRTPADADTALVSPLAAGANTAAKAPPAGTGNKSATAGSQPLVWPADVGTSHFGIIGPLPQPFDFTGAWNRPHPGPFAWGDVEATPETYDWSRIDAVVRRLQTQRVAILATVWPFADWDQKAGYANQPQLPPNTFPQFLPSRRYAPHDWAAYTAWLQAMVQRYDGDGIHNMPGLQYPIRHWEILNEPELREESGTFFQDTPQAYLKLLKQSYETIKKTDPAAMVLLGGQAGMLDNHTSYWKPILAGAQGSFDLGNVHSIGASDSFYGPEYRHWLDQLGYQNKHFWITEALPIKFSQPGHPPPTDDQRARSVLTGFATDFSLGADVILLVSSDPNTPPSPAVNHTFDLMAKTVGDFASAQANGPSTVKFTMRDGSTVYALWNQVHLPSDVTGTCKVITYDGNESNQPASEIVAKVPMLVVVPSPIKK